MTLAGSFSLLYKYADDVIAEVRSTHVAGSWLGFFFLKTASFCVMEQL